MVSAEPEREASGDESWLAGEASANGDPWRAAELVRTKACVFRGLKAVIAEILSRGGLVPEDVLWTVAGLTGEQMVLG